MFFLRVLLVDNIDSALALHNFAIGRSFLHLKLHLVARENPDVMHAHLAGDGRGDNQAVLELNAEHGIAQRLDHCSFLFDGELFYHIRFKYNFYSLVSENFRAAKLAIFF